jgi:2-keto-4-pentenoate hydratase/2-oxohepta-3-ene-1,7-dioic acid hydratase in catechol pathway
MRFATLRFGDVERWGIVEGDDLIVIEHPQSLLSALTTGALADAASLAAGSALRLRLADGEWLPVIPTPAKILCVGLNYETHRNETGRAKVENPTIFTRFADSQTGHGTALTLPPESDKLDYEGELAVIIGKPGRRISAADAMQHVAGYACYNDGSIRDWQAHTIQFIPGKNWPGTGAFGPWMVTPDEFGEIGPQTLTTRLNGEVMQQAVLADMIFNVPRLIEYISTFTPLSAGDVIVSGTPGGVGAKRTPPVFMREGDVVEVEISGIGTLSNTIARHL